VQARLDTRSIASTVRVEKATTIQDYQKISIIVPTANEPPQLKE